MGRGVRQLFNTKRKRLVRTVDGGRVTLAARDLCDDVVVKGRHQSRLRAPLDDLAHAQLPSLTFAKRVHLPRYCKKKNRQFEYVTNRVELSKFTDGQQNTFICLIITAC